MAKQLIRQHGEVLTRSWIVDLMLDLANYTPDRDLTSLVAVEPSFGRGAFFLPMVRRLVRSAQEHGRRTSDMTGALLGVDLQKSNVSNVEALVHHELSWSGYEQKAATSLSRAWTREADYILDPPQHVDLVVGNPPYIRLEEIPADLLKEYQTRCSTMSGRSDLYIGFIEQALRSLNNGGSLAYICADRWMRNQYGKSLRSMVTEDFAVDLVLTMHDVDAFEEQVSAYPAITIISRRSQGPALVADTTREFGSSSAADFKHWVSNPSRPHADGHFRAARLPHWFEGSGFWPTGDPDLLRLLEHLNDNFPRLEDATTGTQVGIGVATGNDKVFVTQDPDLVEPDHLLPLVVRKDLLSGEVEWNGQYLVNPWSDDGSLVDLSSAPRLGAFFETHREALAARHVGKKNPDRWYRTIDKVDPLLTSREMLLFPDMASTSNPVLERGHLYPHHNLYWVTSDRWQLRVLGGLLISRVTDVFIGAYCVRMRGGTMRFQAQYLRQIRVPRIDDISASVAEDLAAAFDARDTDRATELAIEVYGIEAHRSVLEPPA